MTKKMPSDFETHADWVAYVRKLMLPRLSRHNS
jgi:hypothetical protein